MYSQLPTSWTKRARKIYVSASVCDTALYECVCVCVCACCVENWKCVCGASSMCYVCISLSLSIPVQAAECFQHETLFLPSMWVSPNKKSSALFFFLCVSSSSRFRNKSDLKMLRVFRVMWAWRDFIVAVVVVVEWRIPDEIRLADISVEDSFKASIRRRRKRSESCSWSTSSFVFFFKNSSVFNCWKPSSVFKSVFIQARVSKKSHRKIGFNVRRLSEASKSDFYFKAELFTNLFNHRSLLKR